MKKVTVLLILSLEICLAACGKKVSTPDEMWVCFLIGVIACRNME